jgi:GMP synthase-like glutamine amidotransferase
VRAVRILCIHHEEGSGLGTLAGPLRELSHELVVWRAWSAPAPDPGGFGAAISMGGTAHPDQDADHMWLARELALLRALVDREVPVLGVCLGGQLLTRALGGSVARLPAPEIGWHDVELTAAGRGDPLLNHLPDRVAAFEWHHYGFTPPGGAATLARSAAAPVQAARLAPAAWALQFHIEVDDETIDRWCDEGSDELAELGVSPEALRDDTARHGARWRELAHVLAHRFAELAERGATGRPGVRPAMPQAAAPAPD